MLKAVICPASVHLKALNGAIMPGSIVFAIIVNYDMNVSDSNRKLTYSSYEYNYLQLPTIKASLNTSEHNV